MPATPLLSSESHVSSIRLLYKLYPQLAEEQSAEWLDILNNTHMMDAPADTALATQTVPISCYYSTVKCVFIRMMKTVGR